MYNVSVGAGYAYNWLPGIFFVSPFLGLSLGYQKSTWDLQGSGKKSKNGLATNAHAKLGLGINIQNFYFSINVGVDVFQAGVELFYVGLAVARVSEV